MMIGKDGQRTLDSDLIGGDDSQDHSLAQHPDLSHQIACAGSTDFDLHSHAKEEKLKLQEKIKQAFKNKEAWYRFVKDENGAKFFDWNLSVATLCKNLDINDLEKIARITQIIEDSFDFNSQAFIDMGRLPEDLRTLILSSTSDLENADFWPPELRNQGIISLAQALVALKKRFDFQMSIWTLGDIDVQTKKADRSFVKQIFASVQAGFQPHAFDKVGLVPDLVRQSLASTVIVVDDKQSSLDGVEKQIKSLVDKQRNSLNEAPDMHGLEAANEAKVAKPSIDLYTFRLRLSSGSKLMHPSQLLDDHQLSHDRQSVHGSQLPFDQQFSHVQQSIDRPQLSINPESSALNQDQTAFVIWLYDFFNSQTASDSDLSPTSLNLASNTLVLVDMDGVLIATDRVLQDVASGRIAEFLLSDSGFT